GGLWKIPDTVEKSEFFAYDSDLFLRRLTFAAALLRTNCRPEEQFIQRTGWARVAVQVNGTKTTLRPLIGTRQEFHPDFTLHKRVCQSGRQKRNPRAITKHRP